MASIRLKQHKYDLRYGSTTQPEVLMGYLTPVSTTAATISKEDKQIEILRLQIRLAELNQDSRASLSKMPHASSSRASELSS